jgi:hypothetical protein
VEIRCADHTTPATRRKLSLNFGGRPVGIVRLQTQSRGVCFVCLLTVFAVLGHLNILLTLFTAVGNLNILQTILAVSNDTNKRKLALPNCLHSSNASAPSYVTPFAEFGHIAVWAAAPTCSATIVIIRPIFLPNITGGITINTRSRSFYVLIVSFPIPPFYTK